MVWARPHHRLLGPASPPTATTAHDGTMPQDTKDNNIDSNMVIILGVLLFALLCALGLNSVIRCILRCMTTRHHHHHHHNRREVGPRGGTTFIGAATRGLKRSTIKQIPTTNYHTNGKSSSSNNNNNNNNNNVMSTDCMICLGEFMEGEKIKVLPKCKHGFHSKCIDTWLLSHSTCPNCRQSLLEWAGSSGAIVVPMAYENHPNNSSSHNNDGSSGGDASQTRH